MSELAEIATRFQVQLEGLKTSSQRDFNKVQNLMEEILRDGLGTREISELSRRQLENLISRIKENQSLAMSSQVDDLVESLKDLAKYSYEFEAGALVAGSTVERVTQRLSIAELWKKVLEHPLSVDGSLLSSWTNKLTSVQVTSTENLIRRGYIESWSNRELLQAYRGTRANQFKDGIVSTIGRSNETVIRTAMQHVNSVARLKVWEDNDDIVKAYRWVSTLDIRTSSKCRHLDGEEFKIGEGPLPPIHPNCRSTTVAVLDPAFEEFRAGLTRASASGPVPQKLTYYEWLKRQSKDFQDSVLGDSRATLFRDGGMSVEDFTRLQLNRYFKPLTLAEMRKLKPLAFQRAGI